MKKENIVTNLFDSALNKFRSKSAFNNVLDFDIETFLDARFFIEEALSTNETTLDDAIVISLVCVSFVLLLDKACSKLRDNGQYKNGCIFVRPSAATEVQVVLDNMSTTFVVDISDNNTNSKIVHDLGDLEHITVGQIISKFIGVILDIDVTTTMNTYSTRNTIQNIVLQWVPKYLHRDDVWVEELEEWDAAEFLDEE